MGARGFSREERYHSDYMALAVSGKTWPLEGTNKVARITPNGKEKIERPSGKIKSARQASMRYRNSFNPGKTTTGGSKRGADKTKTPKGRGGERKDSSAWCEVKTLDFWRGGVKKR